MTLKPLIAHIFPGFLAPSSYMSDPTLRQVTARSRRSNGTGRSSRRSLARPDSGMRQGQPMSEAQSPRMGMFPRIEEHEMGLCEDALKTSDVEAQRDESVASTVPDEDSAFVGATLRPPPKPRLRPSA
jgi:hypothetical protein